MKRVSIFFIISFLFFLSCDDKKDDDNSPFSIIGSWNYFYLSNEDWVLNNIKWDFRNDGRIYLTKKEIKELRDLGLSYKGIGR